MGLHQVGNLVALTAKADDQRRGNVHMSRVAGDGTAQQVDRFAAHLHAAAKAVTERDDAVDVGVGRQPLRREVLGDLAHDGCRTVYRRADADIVARCDAAIVAHDALERGLLGGRHDVDRPVFAGVRVVAVELAELGVVVVQPGAWFNVLGRKPDRHVVFNDAIALGDAPGGKLTAGRDLVTRRDAFARDLDAAVDHFARHNRVVTGVQPDDRAGDLFLVELKHARPPGQAW